MNTATLDSMVQFSPIKTGKISSVIHSIRDIALNPFKVRQEKTPDKIITVKIDDTAVKTAYDTIKQGLEESREIDQYFMRKGVRRFSYEIIKEVAEKLGALRPAQLHTLNVILNEEVSSSNDIEYMNALFMKLIQASYHAENNDFRFEMKGHQLVKCRFYVDYSIGTTNRIKLGIYGRSSSMSIYCESAEISIEDDQIIDGNFSAKDSIVDICGNVKRIGREYDYRCLVDICNSTIIFRKGFKDAELRGKELEFDALGLVLDSRIIAATEETYAQFSRLSDCIEESKKKGEYQEYINSRLGDKATPNYFDHLYKELMKYRLVVERLKE